MLDLSLLAAAAAAVACLVIVLWLVSLAVRDASIVDIAWGPGFVLVALVAAFLGEGYASRRMLMALLVAAWGLRLGLYLAWRNLGKGEDFRYQKMRSYWGDRFWWVSLFTVFGFQGVMMLLVSLPITVAGSAPTPDRLTMLDALGTALFAIGIFFESVGDAQLALFKRRPENAGKVLDRGLWRYTRHPNYFGDFVVWWGLYCISAATPGRWLALVGPALMSFLLLRVSGVPMLERSLIRNRPDYADYLKRTSAFFPRRPRSA